MAEEWQTPKFRQSIIARINDLLSQSPGQDTNKAGVMESHIFNKSRTKDEYTGLVSKLFLHFKDIAQRRPQQRQQQQQQQQQAPNPEMSQQPMIQDPLNALQTLATQGNRNPQMMSMPGAGGGPGGSGPNQMGGPGGPVAASNLLASLNQQRPGQQQQQQQQQMQQQMQGIRSQLPMNAGGGGGGGPGGPNQQIMPGGGPSGPGMPMNVMGGGGGPGGGGPQGGPNVGPQQQQQMNAMAGHPNQMGPGNAGQNAGGGGPGGPGGGGPGGPVQMNAMNVQQMQQMNQNQMAQMGMNHPQLNQMINARMAQNVQGGNAQGPGGMQQQGPGGLISGGPQQQGGGPGGQPGNLNQMLNMQQKGNMPMGGQPGQMFPVNRNVAGQAPFLRQSPSPSMVASPAGGMGPGQVQQQQLQQQQQQQMQQQQNQIPGGPVSGGSATGPVGNAGVGGPNQQQQQQQQQQQVPTPNSQMGNAQMIPSPALVQSPSPQMSNLMQNNQRQMRQSPSAPLNTPGQVASNSPFNPQEEQLYREKYKQLTKYIEPLKRMVAKIGIDGQNSEKMTKMSKLLEILSSPTQLVPLETLLKCEKALEKMELVYTGQQFGKSSNPLMEVINATLQSPIANHTLHRTFRPSLEVLFGTDICAPSAPKRAMLHERSHSETDHEIPHVLQGEIARLDQKFKVTLDSAMPTNRKEIHLICCLDDHRLPSVPPLYATIPEDYPYVSPECQLHKGDYLSTKFMTAVYYAFSARLSKMSRLYSLSQVLDTWEMSVRHGCSPNAKPLGDLLAVCNG